MRQVPPVLDRAATLPEGWMGGRGARSHFANQASPQSCLSPAHAPGPLLTADGRG